MRILLVTRSLPFHLLGGMEAVAWDLAKGLASLNHAVTVLTTRCASLPQLACVEGVRIHQVDAPSGQYSIPWWLRSRSVYRREYSESVDVVVSVSAGAFGLRRTFPGPIFIGQLHGTSLGQLLSSLRQKGLRHWLDSLRYLGWMIRDFRFRRFDCLVTVGDAVTRDLQLPPARWAVGRRPIVTIANGIDPDQFAFDCDARHAIRNRLGIDATTKVFVSASRLDPQKGIMEGLRAFASAVEKQPAMRYVVIGDGPDELRLKQAVKSLSIEHKVIFAGRVPRAELRRWLSAADFFVFTTNRVEGLALNVLEALAAGLPVILSEHVADERLPAIAVPMGDIERIASAMLEVEAAVSRASRLDPVFTLEHVVEQYLAVISRFTHHARH